MEEKDSRENLYRKSDVLPKPKIKKKINSLVIIIMSINFCGSSEPLKINGVNLAMDQKINMQSSHEQQCFKILPPIPQDDTQKCKY